MQLSMDELMRLQSTELRQLQFADLMPMLLAELTGHAEAACGLRVSAQLEISSAEGSTRQRSSKSAQLEGSTHQSSSEQLC